jgi:hypothetical protein
MYGVRFDFIVETGPDIAAALRLFHHPVGPAEQGFVRIAAPLFAAIWGHDI